jgi:hypothetical protein
MYNIARSSHFMVSSQTFFKGGANPGLERKELHFEGAASMSSESSYSLPQVSV